MLRNGASRLALRTVAAPAVRTTGSIRRTTPSAQWTTQFSSLASRRPHMPLQPIQAAIMQRAYAANLSDGQKQAESRYAHEAIKPTPETVSATSTMHPVFVGEVTDATKTAGGDHNDADMAAGLKHDVATVKETFSLSNVPKEAYYMGLAGTLPYLATSLSTVYLGWELNHSNSGYGYLLSEANATWALHLIEPLQIGYGASILSFLGAIHWGLEWAGFGGKQGYKRYAIGVVAPAVAWSTLLMPIEGALITQFLGFVGLYYVDVVVGRKGWTPTWYPVYRFVLTFIVGASLVVSLIGRSELPDHIPNAEHRAKIFKEEGSSEEKLAEHEKASAESKKKAARKDDRDKH